MDLVGTCPKDFFKEWIAEGDAAGDPDTGQEYNWGTGSLLARRIQPGDRFYIVARGKLRGWATVKFVEAIEGERRAWNIVRGGGAVACTIPQEIHGFQGLRVRWWKREDEIPFPNWREFQRPGTPAEKRQGRKERKVA
jgi:hypothetical protein